MSQTDAPVHPNLILIMTDDQGYGDFGCHGNSIIHTPNLDRLHAESTRLTDFHVNPLCAPTRAALMTGRYCDRTGVWATIRGRSILRRDEVTMADVFAASGYRTGVFGKWHLGDNYPYHPQDRGFQETLVHGGGGVCQTPDYWGNDYFDDTYWRNGVPEPQRGYCTDVFFDAAMDFVERNRDRPFFVYLPTNAPHSPFNVPDGYADRYLEQGVPENRARFWGMITNIDENVGRMSARLDELGLAENTILIFLTDNGTAAGFDPRTGDGFNAGLRATKGSQYDGGHRVPIFIRWPGRLAGGRDVDRLTAHIDLLPTFVDLCHLPPPADVRFDGTSLAALLTGDASDWPERTLCVNSQQQEHPEKWLRCAVMTDRWRLVDGKELYDMPADRAQDRDVAAEHPDVVAELREAYERWWADVSERFDGYCSIVIGSDRENPARLTAHDWHDADEIPWNFGHIANPDMYPNGFWAIDVERPGTYEFTVRRFPVEEDAPLNATTARLQIGDVDLSRSVDPAAPEATFRVDLQPGPTRLQTWLINEPTGTERGAYYVSARRI